MQTRRRIPAVVLCSLVYSMGAAGIALAETIVIDDQLHVRESTVETPKRGVTMEQVQAKFGAPLTKHDAVGTPPITRWDYASFSVFFEHDRVIHAVAIPNSPASPNAPASNAPASSPSSASG